MTIETDIAAPPQRTVETHLREKPADLRRSGAANAALRSGAAFAKIADEIDEKANAENASAKKPARETSGKGFAFWQSSEFGFGDFLDIINPLQHVPIVATLYRNLTGDQIGMVPRVVGGALWGRIGGFVAGIANAVVEWFTGKDIGDHIYAAIWGKPETPKDKITVAHAARSESSPAQLRDTNTETVALPVELAPVEAMGLELRQDSPSVPRQAAVPPLSSNGIAEPSVVLSHVFTSRYRREDDRSEFSENQKRLRVTA